MLIHKKIITRPNTSAEWFEGTDDYNALVEEFKNSKLIISLVKTFSDDQLTKTVETAFADEEGFLTWRNHPTVKANRRLRVKHETAVGIESTFDFVFQEEEKND